MLLRFYLIEIEFNWDCMKLRLYIIEIVGGEGQDTSWHFEGSFGSIRAILPMWGLGAKTGAKTKIWTERKHSLVIFTIRFVIQKISILEKIKLKLDKKWPSYANLMLLSKIGIWSILCQLMAIWPMVRDMNFKFVLPKSKIGQK